MTNSWPLQRDMNAFYGNPDVNQDGVADRDWEAANIVRIMPPYPLFYPNEDQNGRLVKRAIPWGKRGLPVHKRCADSLLRCLSRIPQEFSAEEIQRLELDICGGAYNFRLMRNGRALSIHSWGAAIDLSHLINAYRRPYNESAGMMPQRVVKIFAEEGWIWGGLWSTADGMHFQAARV